MGKIMRVLSTHRNLPLFCNFLHQNACLSAVARGGEKKRREKERPDEVEVE